MKKIAHIIVFILMISILLVNIFSIFEVPFFGFNIYRVGSGSMSPYLNTNDFIIIKDTNIYVVGDVVTYKIDGIYITHRIISISDDEIITKGDANNIEDSSITKDMIIGKLILKIRMPSFVTPLVFNRFTPFIIFGFGIVILFLTKDKN